MEWNWDDGVGCSECGASLWEEAERAFSLAPREYLCCQCATSHGGVYDDARATWIRPPDLGSVRSG